MSDETDHLSDVRAMRWWYIIRSPGRLKYTKLHQSAVQPVDAPSMKPEPNMRVCLSMKEGQILPRRGLTTLNSFKKGDNHSTSILKAWQLTLSMIRAHFPSPTPRPAASHQRLDGIPGSSAHASYVDDELEDEDDRPAQSIPPEAFAPGYFKRFFVEERLLGSGGKGVVLLVRHQIGDHSIGLFACKRIPVGNDPKWLKKIIQEAQLLQQLSNSHLVRYDWSWLEEFQISRFGPPVPCVFIIQEYCDGGDLFDFVKRPPSKYGPFTPDLGVESDQDRDNSSSGRELSPCISQQASASSFEGDSAPRTSSTRPLDFKEISSFFKDIASGLSYLHRSGYVHRDLKPHNCLLKMPKAPGDRLKVVLSDFGEMQPSSSTRTSTGYTATLSYCAPEVLTLSDDGNYGNFTQKSDIFSLGMILYFMCFADLPYRAANVSNEKDENIQELRSEISKWSGFEIGPVVRHDLPEKLYTFLKQLLSSNPEDRPTAESVLQAVKTEVHFGLGTGPGRLSTRATSPGSPTRPQSASRVSPVESPPILRRGSAVVRRRTSDGLMQTFRGPVSVRSMPLTDSSEFVLQETTPPPSPRLGSFTSSVANLPLDRQSQFRSSSGAEIIALDSPRSPIVSDEKPPAAQGDRLADNTRIDSDAQKWLLMEAPPPSAIWQLYTIMLTGLQDPYLLVIARISLFSFKAAQILTGCDPLLPKKLPALVLLFVASLDLHNEIMGRGTAGRYEASTWIVTGLLAVLHLALTYLFRTTGAMCPSRHAIPVQASMKD